jgi:hypothetical protein
MNICEKRGAYELFDHPQEGWSTLRPVDVMVYGCVGEKYACVNLTGVSPLLDCRLRLLL